MDDVPGVATFQATGDAYDSFMGRYSRPLAEAFANTIDLSPGLAVLDVGCGPGALTGVLVERLGGQSVTAIDPSASFVEACAARHRGVDVRIGRAEQIPSPDGRFDVAVAQLVLHFVSDPDTAASELRRVVRPGGTVAACVWDFEEGMAMLRHFWDAALAVDPDAPDEARTMRFGRQSEIVDLFETAGLQDVVETTIDVRSHYGGFDELWQGFLQGIGPAGSYCVSLSEEHRDAVRLELFQRVGSPAADFELSATARIASGRRPR